MKNPLTRAGIEAATFRFVAQHLNHCATAVPQLDALIFQNYFWNKILHVSDSSSVHHQEFFTLQAAVVYIYIYIYIFNEVIPLCINSIYLLYYI